MSTLYLHVGHSKTGTSWLQAALRENSIALAKCGLAYPIVDGVGAEEGAEIGQGNGVAFAVSPPEMLGSRLRSIDRTDCTAGIVLSAEEFFPRLTFYEEPGMLRSAASEAGFERIKILLFIRNPVGHAASLWQQYLKRGGGSVPIDALFEKYSVPERVELFLNRFTSLDGVSLTCLNYSRHRNNLLSPLCVWLGLHENALIPPRTSVINRGMTNAELALQSALNKQMGKAGRILSDALCSGLPELRPDRVLPDMSCQREMCNRLAPTLERVNAYLMESEWYRNDIQSTQGLTGNESLVFDREQIEIIGAVLGKEIRKLRLTYFVHEIGSSRLLKSPPSGSV